MRIKAFIALLFLFPVVHAGSKDDIGNTIIEEIQKFITFVFDMIKDYILEPATRIFKNLFGGLADSIYSVGIGMFSGATGAMDTAWRTLADWIGFTGPFAPIISAAVIWGVVIIAIFVVVDIIADKWIPKPFEKEIED